MTTAGQRHLDRLVRFTGFPSVSGDPKYAPAMDACRTWLMDELRSIGLREVGLVETGGEPVIVGERLERDDLPTVLVYGHYDVQPPDPLDAWTSPPFAATVREGALVARGASDNKGQLVAALGAIEELIGENGALPCSLRVLIEGEEETRADNLEALLTARRGTTMLDADLALVTDSGLLSLDAPGVPVGLRGMVYLDVAVRTAAADLHSGIWGGVAPNAALELAALLATLKDPATGRVLVDGFYGAVDEVDPEELASWERLGFDPDAEAASIGARALTGEEGRTWRERMWSRPTLDVCGLWSGHTGPEVKTIIPAEARAMISCRIVPSQRAQDIVDAVVRHLEGHVPPWATLQVVSTLAGADGVVLPAGHPGVRAALTALRDTWDAEPSLLRAGYSVPVVDLLARCAGLPSVMLGFMLPDDRVHAPDERIRLDVFERARATYRRFLEELPRAMAEGGA
jgi:acetylornithine deacetylase/succinyl-diaminopimelate desuccinylase-like protein